MGLFDWLSNLFGASPRQAPPARDLQERGPGYGRRESPNLPPRRDVPPLRPVSKVLQGLDAEQFTPIDDAEARRQAKVLGRPLWSNPWFGRRDLIPPTSDQRTVLVDRMMIAEGITSAEELAEIHAIGAEMDRVRPDVAHAAERARATAALDREARIRLKEKKKAEAAERKRQYAEAVAERKRSDIVFLGRGVSRGLTDRQSDEAKLERFQLPVLSTPADLASALSVSIATLRWLAFHNEASKQIHYVQFAIPKKSGGTRVLASPHQQLRQTQRWVLDNILSRIAIHDAAHGFVASRGTVSNAVEHVGQTIVVNADLQDFFPTITFYRVEGLFRSLGYSGAVAAILGLLVTESPRQLVRFNGDELWVATGPRALPQGACTSPALSNAIAWNLDKRLAGMAASLGWNYTRYADDLTFSTSKDHAHLVGYLLARLRHIAQDEGFRLNRDKTRVQRRNTQQSVTGIVVNDRPGISRKSVRKLRAILHNAKRTGLAAQNRDGHPHFEAWLQGMIAYVRMVNPDQAASLADAFEQLRS